MWDGTPPDDFEILEGIGNIYERRLYSAGICSYAALANATPEQLAEICKAPTFHRPDYGFWIAQARQMVATTGNRKPLIRLHEKPSFLKKLGFLYPSLSLFVRRSTDAEGLERNATGRPNFMRFTPPQSTAEIPL